MNNLEKIIIIKSLSEKYFNFNDYAHDNFLVKNIIYDILKISHDEKDDMKISDIIECTNQIVKSIPQYDKLILDVSHITILEIIYNQLTSSSIKKLHIRCYMSDMLHKLNIEKMTTSNVVELVDEYILKMFMEQSKLLLKT